MDFQEHVRNLKRHVKRNREERARDVEKSKAWRERVRVIQDAPYSAKQDFWCSACAQDFTGDAFRCVRYPKGTLPIAWYVGFCPVGHKALRRITDKQSDPYYFNSDMLKRQRASLGDAFLTPADPRFRFVYPQKWKELETMREAREMANLSVFEDHDDE